MTLAKENAPSASLWMETGYMYRLAATDWPQRPVSSAQPGLQASGETRRVEGLAGHVRCVALLAQRKRLAGIFCVSCPCAVSLSCDRSVCLSWRVEICRSLHQLVRVVHGRKKSCWEAADLFYGKGLYKPHIDGAARFPELCSRRVRATARRRAESREQRSEEQRPGPHCERALSASGAPHYK